MTSDQRPVIPLPSRPSEADKIGGNFGRTPMGAQVQAQACLCEPFRIAGLSIPDIACPQHGLAAFIRQTFEAGE